MNDRALARSSPGEPSPAEVVAALNGKLMWGPPRRAVDMQIFDLGERVPIVNRGGHNYMIGEYRLHIQSDWRFVRAGVAFVTYDDIRLPTTDAPDAAFDPDLGSRTLRDELLERFISNSSDRERTVEQATVTKAGGLLLRFRGGATLDVDPEDAKSEREAWRLLRPDGSHAVMLGSRFEIARPPPS
jgi:hypothetical protein